MNQIPSISVVMPVYNAARYLPLAVESILRQTFRDFEFIAVDDGSADASRSILEGYAAKDSRVRVISRANTGIVGALSDGLKAARGRYIARMDGDDLCQPERLARQLEFLRARPDVCLVGGAVEFIDASARRLKSYRPPTDAKAIRQALLEGNGGALIHPAIMGPRAAWTAVGGYRQQYNYVEDYDLFLRMLRIGPLANLAEPVLAYRIHAQSTNYRRRDIQVRLLGELCLAARIEAGLDPAFTPAVTPAHPNRASVYREWTKWAEEGGELDVACFYAAKACLNRPWKRENLSLLFHTLRRRVLQKNP